uniref:Spermatogenesis associated glutamate (E)-rich protein 1K n=1 Tax=Mus musculus TaxID=10090 RepID=A0AA74KT21_MOUSE
MFARLCNLFGRVNVDGREARERRKDAGLPSESNEGRRRWTWRIWRARRHTSSTAPDVSKKKFKKEKERLTTELHLLIQLRNEQRDHLIDFKESSNYNRNLHSQLLMEKNLKMSITQNQKNKEVQIDWALIEKYLVDLNLNGRTGADQQP